MSANALIPLTSFGVHQVTFTDIDDPSIMGTGKIIDNVTPDNNQEMIDILTFTMPLLPIDKPNHLLGIGDLQSIESCIKLGIDTFDSSYPTRCARHGLLFTHQGFI